MRVLVLADRYRTSGPSGCRLGGESANPLVRSADGVRRVFRLMSIGCHNWLSGREHRLHQHVTSDHMIRIALTSDHMGPYDLSRGIGAIPTAIPRGLWASTKTLDITWSFLSGRVRMMRDSAERDRLSGNRRVCGTLKGASMDSSPMRLRGLLLRTVWTKERMCKSRSWTSRRGVRDTS